jgi:hypothetical protein
VDIQFSPLQLDAVRKSLSGSVDRAGRKITAAASADERQFYEYIVRDCQSALDAIESQLKARDVEPDEDVCDECGEDVGFCQYEEEEEDDQ